MDKITFKNKTIFAIGDIHGNFETAIYEISRHRLEDSVIIVAGDCGFGFHQKGYYDSLLNRLNSKLKKLRSTVIFIRGNHDDPMYFTTDLYDLEYIKTVRDYTIISIDNDGCNEYNILCIGGAISIDRTLRIKNDESFNGKLNIRKHPESRRYSYWSDENFNLNTEILNEMYGINCIVTHGNPYHNNGIISGYVKEWCNLDSTLMDDILSEHTNMREMLDILLLNGNEVKLWVNGHYHTSCINHIERYGHEIKCVSLRNIENGIDIVDIGGRD